MLNLILLITHISREIHCQDTRDYKNTICFALQELVIMSLYSSGRDEDSFPNALEFQPRRWRRSAAGYDNVRNPQASLPFAMGARACIGKKIAEIQIMTTISKV